mgnify:CR=1 FL=1
MIEKGEIPMVDGAIFADVKGEPLAVYKHLNWLKKKLLYPYILYQVIECDQFNIVAEKQF